MSTWPKIADPSKLVNVVCHGQDGKGAVALVVLVRLLVSLACMDMEVFPIQRTNATRHTALGPHPLGSGLAIVSVGPFDTIGKNLDDGHVKIVEALEAR